MAIKSSDCVKDETSLLLLRLYACFVGRQSTDDRSIIPGKIRKGIVLCLFHPVSIIASLIVLPGLVLVLLLFVMWFHLFSRRSRTFLTLLRLQLLSLLIVEIGVAEL